MYNICICLLMYTYTYVQQKIWKTHRSGNRKIYAQFHYLKIIIFQTHIPAHTHIHTFCMILSKLDV